MPLPSNEVEWSLFLPFLKLDPKSHRVIAGIAVSGGDDDETFVETDDGLLPLSDLKRELAALSGSSATTHGGIAKNITSGALYPGLGDPAKAWWVSARIDDANTWHQIRAGKMAGLELRGRAHQTLKRDVSDELRLPAGQPAGGQWTSGGSTGAPTSAPTESRKPQPNADSSATTAAAAAGSIAIDWSEGSSLVTAARGLALTGVGTMLAAAASAYAIFNTLFIPTNNKSLVAEGSLPDHPDFTYRYDGESGVLFLWHNGNTLFSGYYGADGIFRDGQGKPLGRAIATDGIIIDTDALKAIHAKSLSDKGTRADAQPLTQTDVDKDDQKICPAPGPDTPGGRKLRGLAYEGYIHSLVNKEHPLAVGLAVNLNGLNFDDCYREDPEKGGTMVEAKGEGYLDMLNKPSNKDQNFLWAGVEAKMVRQAANQVLAAGPRKIVWFFAEKEVADRMRDVFSTAGFSQIDVEWRQPPADYIERYGPKDYKEKYEKLIFLGWIRDGLPSLPITITRKRPIHHLQHD